jgi:hypothetical protein
MENFKRRLSSSEERRERGNAHEEVEELIVTLEEAFGHEPVRARIEHLLSPVGGDVRLENLDEVGDALIKGVGRLTSRFGHEAVVRALSRAHGQPPQ